MNLIVERLVELRNAGESVRGIWAAETTVTFTFPPDDGLIVRRLPPVAG